MIENKKYKLLFSTKLVLLLILYGCFSYCTAQDLTERNKITMLTTQTLPHQIFFQLIDSTESFVINHQTEFKHIDVPKKYYNQFTAYIKDSVAQEIIGMKSLVYYNYKLTNGKYVNGDIFWNNTNGYIVFKIDDIKYVNYFTKDGIQQLNNLFKL